MGWRDSNSEFYRAHQTIIDPHFIENSITNEVIGAAAAYETLKAFDIFCTEHGKPPSVEVAMNYLDIDADRYVFQIMQRAPESNLDPEVDELQARKVAKQDIEKGLKEDGVE